MDTVPYQYHTSAKHDRRERMKVRRVVTGHDSQGKARVVDDRDVEPITTDLMPGQVDHASWSTLSRRAS
jgi:hypothetical protein